MNMLYIAAYTCLSTVIWTYFRDIRIDKSFNQSSVTVPTILTKYLFLFIWFSFSDVYRSCLAFYCLFLFPELLLCFIVCYFVFGVVLSFVVLFPELLLCFIVNFDHKFDVEFLVFIIRGQATKLLLLVFLLLLRFFFFCHGSLWQPVVYGTPPQPPV